MVKRNQKDEWFESKTHFTVKGESGQKQKETVKTNSIDEVMRKISL